MNFYQFLLLIKQYLFSQHAKKSYAQEGEDLILDRIFENEQEGIYIDVGAHHPLRFSNTYLLYKKGWHGINIDANPGSMAYFRFLRPHDINLEIAIGAKNTVRDFYIFNESAINTFDKKIVRNNLKVGYQLTSVRKTKIIPLKVITDKYLEKCSIDLLSIDVEGMDLEVLESMDWSKRPRVIVVESLGSDLDALNHNHTYKYLMSKKYRLFAKTANSLIFLTNK